MVVFGRAFAVDSKEKEVCFLYGKAWGVTMKKISILFFLVKKAILLASSPRDNVRIAATIKGIYNLLWSDRTPVVQFCLV